MKLLFIFLAISTLFWVFVFPYILRAYARIRADRLISGELPPNENQIRRCISILTWTNKWITSHTYDDDLKIRKLKPMLCKTQ